MTNLPANDAYADRYSVHYSVYGKGLDVGTLLEGQRPTSEFEDWREGEGRGEKRVTKTAGVRIQIVEDGDPQRVIGAIERFLDTDRAFLHAAAQHAGGDVFSVLSCAMWVYAKVPTTICLSDSLMARLAALRIVWEVTGYPCADDEGP